MISTATLLTFLATIATGVIVGILSALFGIGGGVVMIPIIRLIFSRTAVVSSATSLFAIFPTSVTGVISRHKEGNTNYKVGAVIGVAGALTSPLGASLGSSLPGIYAMVITAVVIVFTAVKQILDAKRLGDKGDNYRNTNKIPAQYQYLAVAALGLFIGVFSGYLGLGGGFIVVPLLSYLLGMNIKEASATSLVAIVILGLPGVITHAFYGNIDYLLGISFIIGSIPGAKLGSLIVKKVSNRGLTIAFAIVLMLAGVALAINELL
ncbi:MAG: sulfite exporter TauE/SafE family protein [Coriobacteriia bacterium]|nr:sulfite exporter TauE/SafE family protein [Coriobacteriia bacterium]